MERKENVEKGIYKIQIISKENRLIQHSTDDFFVHVIRLNEIQKGRKNHIQIIFNWPQCASQTWCATMDQDVVNRWELSIIDPVKSIIEWNTNKKSDYIEQISLMVLEPMIKNFCSLDSLLAGHLDYILPQIKSMQPVAKLGLAAESRS